MSAYLAAWLAFLGVLLFFLGLELRKNDSMLEVYIKDAVPQGVDIKDIGWKDISERVGPMVNSLLPVFNLEKIRQKLTWAGNPYNLTEAGFIGLKVGLCAAGLILAITLAMLGVPLVAGLVLTALLYFLPDLVLHNRVEQRKKAMFNSLPNMIGL